MDLLIIQMSSCQRSCGLNLTDLLFHTIKYEIFVFFQGIGEISQRPTKVLKMAWGLPG